MRKIGFVIFAGVVFITSLLIANTTIQGKHNGLKKDGKTLNCAFCHTTSVIKKEAGQGMGIVNNNTNCQGSGCHPR